MRYAMRHSLLIILFLMMSCQGAENNSPQPNFFDDYIYDSIAHAFSWTHEKAACAILWVTQTIQENVGIDGLKQLTERKNHYEKELTQIDLNITALLKDHAHITLSPEILSHFKQLPEKTDVENYTLALEEYKKALTIEQESFTSKYGALQKPSALLACLRYGGYATALVAGGYTGNVIYTRFLQSYFTQHTSRADLIKKITELEETYELMLAQCTEQEEQLAQAPDHEQRTLTIALAQLKAQIEIMISELDALNDQLSNPQQPSSSRQLAGTTIRCALIAATAYLFYKGFEKLDTAYLHQKPLTGEEEKLVLEKEACEATLKDKQLHLGYAQTLLNNDKKHILDELIKRLKYKLDIEKALKEVIEALEKAPQEQQVQILAYILNSYRG